MKKKVLVSVLTLGLILGSSMGTMAKGQPANSGSNNGKNKTEVVSQQTVESEQSVTENQEKNQGEAKVLREQIKLERTNTLKNALKSAGINDADAEDVIEEYEPAKGVFKVKGQHPVFDVPPVIKAGRTLIPVRAIMNGLGAEVSWDAEAQKVTVTKDGKTIEIFLNSQEVLVDGQAVTIDVPAGMIANRVFVPMRFISETLGELVDYDPETGDVTIGDEVIDEVENTEEVSDENTTDENATDENSDEESDDTDVADENTDDETDSEEGSDEETPSETI